MEPEELIKRSAEKASNEAKKNLSNGAQKKRPMKQERMDQMK